MVHAQGVEGLKRIQTSHQTCLHVHHSWASGYIAFYCKWIGLSSPFWKCGIQMADHKYLTVIPAVSGLWALAAVIFRIRAGFPGDYGVSAVSVFQDFHLKPLFFVFPGHDGCNPVNPFLTGRTAVYVYQAFQQFQHFFIVCIQI